MAFLSSLITTVVLVFLNAIILTFLSQKFDLGDKSYFTALTITIVLGIFSFLLSFLNSFIAVIITLPLGFYLIRWKYGIKWMLTLKVWSLFFVLSVAAGFLVGIVAGLVLAFF